MKQLFLFLVFANIVYFLMPSGEELRQEDLSVTPRYEKLNQDTLVLLSLKELEAKLANDQVRAKARQEQEQEQKQEQEQEKEQEQ